MLRCHQFRAFEIATDPAGDVNGKLENLPIRGDPNGATAITMHRIRSARRACITYEDGSILDVSMAQAASSARRG
ncbi:MAG: hypothetical protein JO210_06145 [Acidobacteriaceae bacterium]|nr:hypothetical protein [Acidobacteriaceae bacterium]